MGVYYVVISDKNAQKSEKGQYPGYLWPGYQWEDEDPCKEPPEEDQEDGTGAAIHRQARQEAPGTGTVPTHQYGTVPTYRRYPPFKST